jgi:type VI secretion system protein ImpB
MKRQGTQHRIERIRPPRVNITYEVETGGAPEKKELPFVLGVLAELGGHQKNQKKLRDRKFIEITPDNFDTVLDETNPTLSFDVENTLSGDPDAPRLKVNLNFGKEGREDFYERIHASDRDARFRALERVGLDRFTPDEIVAQVEPLRKLMEARNRLKHLVNNLQGNEDAEQLLFDAISSTEKLERLAAEVNPAGEGEK